jgi:hypothetical protein
MPCGVRSPARDSDEKSREICGARGSKWWGQVAPNVHLNPGNAGTGSSARQSLGLRKPVQVTVYKFVGMMWNICLEEKIRVDQLRGDIL